MIEAIVQGFEALNTTIVQEGTKMSAELDALTAEVAAVSTVAQSAVVLIQGLRQAIIDAGTDPVALQALTDDLRATEQALSNAVAENTTP